MDNDIVDAVIIDDSKAIDVETLMLRQENKRKKEEQEELVKYQKYWTLMIEDCNELVNKIEKSDTFPLSHVLKYYHYDRVDHPTRKMINNMFDENYVKELRKIMSERIIGSDKKMYVKMVNGGLIVQVGFKTDFELKQDIQQELKKIEQQKKEKRELENERLEEIQRRQRQTNKLKKELDAKFTCTIN
jgi:hypothetical protein